MKDEIDENYGRKMKEKRVNSTMFGQNRSLVPVPNRGGTGTIDVEAKRYRYHPKRYRYH